MVTHARPRSASSASAASWASTTPSSAACSPAAGACRTSIAQVIEAPPSPDAEGEAAIVRLADMLAHYVLGGPITPSEMLNVARSVNLSRRNCAQCMYELPLRLGEQPPPPGRSVPDVQP